MSSTGLRAVLAGVALVSPWTVSCGEKTLGPRRFSSVSGHIAVEYRVRNALFAVLETRRLAAVDRVVVYLLQHGEVVDSTWSLSGGYNFIVSQGGLFQVATGLWPLLSDLTPTFNVGSESVTLGDTLLVRQRRGSILVGRTPSALGRV